MVIGKERKQAAKASKDAEKKAQQSKLQMIENVIVTCAREVYPETPEEKEKYFMDQVATGEELCKQGKRKDKEKEREGD